MKILRIVLSLLFLSGPCWGDASLQYGGATSDRSDCGSAASLDNLTRFTIMMWFRPTTQTQGRGLIDKDFDGSASGIVISMGFTSGEITLQVNMATQDLFMDTTNAGIANNKWHYLAVAYDSYRAAPYILAYIGSSTESVRLMTTDNTFPGSGGRSPDSGQNLLIGTGNAGTSLAFQGQIGAVHITSEALTIDKINNQRFAFYPTTNTVLLVNNGFDGTGTDRDWSTLGNNCTVTGAARSNIGYGPNFLGGPF